MGRSYLRVHARTISAIQCGSNGSVDWLRSRYALPGEGKPRAAHSATHRTIVVGDIHGCYDELRQLLDAVAFRTDDLLVSVGDIIDRGPDSWQVARFFRRTTNAVSVRGKHDACLHRETIRKTFRNCGNKWSPWRITYCTGEGFSFFGELMSVLCRLT
ncbi:MAG: metallophosphoesterase [bacterium]